MRKPMTRRRFLKFPTAAGQEPDYYKWIEKGIAHFSGLGIEAHGIPIIARDDAHRLAKKLHEFNFYYFSGGNPSYLLDTLKDTPAWETMYTQFTQGATLIGSSAGAMVLGKMAWTRVYEFMNRGVLAPWEKGLGAVEFGIIPHYDTAQREFSREQWKTIHRLLPHGIPVIGIDENTAYIRLNGKWHVKGKGRVHKVQSPPGR